MLQDWNCGLASSPSWLWKLMTQSTSFSSQVVKLRLATLTEFPKEDKTLQTSRDYKPAETLHKLFLSMPPAQPSFFLSHSPPSPSSGLTSSSRSFLPTGTLVWGVTSIMWLIISAELPLWMCLFHIWDVFVCIRSAVTCTGRKEVFFFFFSGGKTATCEN